MDELTEVDKLIITALSSNEWRSRSAIAEVIERGSALNQYDVRRLERLVENRLVEKRQTPISKARTVYEYRLKVQS